VFLWVDFVFGGSSENFYWIKRVLILAMVLFTRTIAAHISFLKFLVFKNNYTFFLPYKLQFLIHKVLLLVHPLIYIKQVSFDYIKSVILICMYMVLYEANNEWILTGFGWMHYFPTLNLAHSIGQPKRAVGLFVVENIIKSI
jgi:hypothetical protein